LSGRIDGKIGSGDGAGGIGRVPRRRLRAVSAICRGRDERTSIEARNCMSKKQPIVRERKIAIDPNPKGNQKALGGAQYDDWNNWLASRTSLALPVNQMDDDRATEAFGPTKTNPGRGRRPIQSSCGAGRRGNGCSAGYFRCGGVFGRNSVGPISY